MRSNKVQSQRSSSSSMRQSRQDYDQRDYQNARRQRQYIYKQTDKIIQNMIAQKSEIQNPFALINDIVLRKDKKIQQLQKQLSHAINKLRKLQTEGIQRQHFISDSGSNSYSSKQFSGQEQRLKYQQLLQKRQKNFKLSQQYGTRMATFLSSVLNFIQKINTQNKQYVKVPKEEYRNLVQNVKDKFNNNIYSFERPEQQNTDGGIQPVSEQAQFMINKKQLIDIKQKDYKKRMEQIFRRLEMTQQWNSYLDQDKRHKSKIIKQVDQIKKIQGKIVKNVDESYFTIFKPSGMDSTLKSNTLSQLNEQKAIWQNMSIRLEQFKRFMYNLQIQRNELQTFEEIIRHRKTKVLTKIIDIQIKIDSAKNFLENLQKDRIYNTQSMIKFMNDYVNLFFEKMASFYDRRKVPISKHLRKNILSEQVKEDMIRFQFDLAFDSIKRSVNQIFQQIQKHTIFWNYDTICYRTPFDSRNNQEDRVQVLRQHMRGFE